MVFGKRADFNQTARKNIHDPKIHFSCEVNYFCFFFFFFFFFSTGMTPRRYRVGRVLTKTTVFVFCFGVRGWGGG